MDAAQVDASLRYLDLGPVGVERGGSAIGVGGPRVMTVLSLFLINLNQRVSTDALVEAMWGELVPAGAEAALDSHLYRLRKALEPDRPRGRPFATVVNEAGGFRLVAPPSQVDSTRFEVLAGDTRDLVASGQLRRAITRCDEALGLWRGRPWTPYSDEPWASTATDRLAELRTQLRERRVECLLGLGSADQALVELDALVAEYPLREHLWRQRMLAAYRLGRTDEALATFQQARATLVDELGIEPGPELRDLQSRILEADSTLAAPVREVAAVRPARVVQLPRRRSDLVGRDRELSELVALLGSEPMTTVVGPAGCGKTRLVIEAARSAGAFPDGVWYVDVSAAQDRAGAVDAVAAALGLEIGEAGTAVAALQAFSRSRRMLLVLDNSSPLIDPVAELVELLTEIDTETAIVVTSREPLEIEGERLWRLGPLAVPEIPDPEGADPEGADPEGADPEGADPEGATGQALDALRAEPTVRLFLERATAAGVQITADDLPTVARICVAVDGLPLAIELAAAQARSFGLAEVLDNVRRDASSLARIGRGSEITLADLIEQSVSRLNPTERQVHRAMAVVPGEVTATLVATIADLPDDRVRNALTGLVHRSLVVPHAARPAGGRSRFAQLGPIRGHAHAGASDGALTELEGRRDAWVAATVTETPRMGGPGEASWYARLDDDLPAIRATLQRTLVERPASTGTLVASRLGLYWYYRGMGVEWERWTRLAVDCAVAEPFDRLLAGLSLGCALGLAGRSDLAPAYVDAVDSYHHPMDRAESIMLGEFVFAVASTSRATRDLVLGRRAATHVRRLADRTGDATLDLFAEIATLESEVSTGDQVELLARSETAYERALDLGNDYAAWTVATVGAAICLNQRNPAEGLRWSDRTLSQYVRLGIGEAAGPLTLRGGLLAVAGEFYEAAMTLAAARAQARRSGQRWPRTAATWKLVEIADSRLSTTDRERAYREGSLLTLSDIPLRYL